MDFAAFRDRVAVSFRLSLDGYKEPQLRRRVESLMARRKIRDYGSYFELLVADGSAYREFLDYLTINVTEFFRDPAMFRRLEEELLPELLGSGFALRIWSAGCANGAEPYSVAIILEELTPGRRHRIEGTDVDGRILEVAREGRYPAELLRHVGPARRRRYFRPEGRDFVLDASIRRRVEFRRHDLLRDPYGTGYDLIMCRNVTIYFTREAQARVNEGLARALKPGGILFVGGAETIFNYRELGYEKIGPCFYRKVRGG
ncbi:MAG: protein-glutamate O-methyltransferase CheR [Firmicutes bacterium]|nr:protein-glutamate O-methyltransferase CheR [Bacillota bacterium]